MKNNILKNNIIKERVSNKQFLFVSYFLLIIITILVYFTGGTSKVYANLMYIPIVMIASTNGIKHSIIHAGLSGLALGYFMPLDVTLHIRQEPINWILRIIIYLIIAFVVGFFSEYSKEESETINQKEDDITKAQWATIYSLIKISEVRDHNTGKHIERVVALSRLLVEKLYHISKYKNYIDDEYINNISKASALHDIGKVAISDSILLKPGKLSKEEFEIMKTHTTIGTNVLLEVKEKYPENKFIELAISITNFHHEKWDGTGYPSGLSGENIPLSARIVSLVDVYDSLRSKRVYKKEYSHKESIEIIKQGEGTHFDPQILNVFISNEAEFKMLFDDIMVDKSEEI